MKSLIPLVLCIGFLAGCNSEQLDKARADLATARTTLQTAIDTKAAIDAELAVLPPDALPAELITRSEQIGQVLIAAQEAVTRLEQEIASAQDGLDAAQGVLNTAAPFIPPPYGSLAAGLGGLVIGLLRARQNRNAGRKLARSIERAKVEGKITLDADAKGVLDLEQDAAAKRLVNEAQGRVSPMPF